jgi:hypothetical protein
LAVTKILLLYSLSSRKKTQGIFPCVRESMKSGVFIAILIWRQNQ